MLSSGVFLCFFLVEIYFCSNLISSLNKHFYSGDYAGKTDGTALLCCLEFCVTCLESEKSRNQ